MQLYHHFINFFVKIMKGENDVNIATYYLEIKLKKNIPESVRKSQVFIYFILYCFFHIHISSE